MFYVYILRSWKDGKKYVGHTNNIERRLNEHNRGECMATKNRKPFEVIYFETAETKSIAVKKEDFFKSGKGREYINKILN